MTPDDYTTADAFSDAATASYEDYVRQPRMNVGTARDRIAEAHVAGWEAARVYLTQQEPTEDEVLAAMTAYEGQPTRAEAWRAALRAARDVRGQA